MGGEQRGGQCLGRVLDRFGKPWGHFLWPVGTPFPQRALPASHLAEPYHMYEVLKPLPATEALVAPAFREPGYGVRFELDRSVQRCVEEGYLREVCW